MIKKVLDLLSWEPLDHPRHHWFQKCHS